MIFLVIAVAMLGSFVAGALTTRKTVGVLLRHEREQHFWTKKRLTAAAESVGVLSSRVNAMVADPRIALRAAQLAYELRSKDWARRRYQVG